MMVWRLAGWEMTAGTACSRRLCVYFSLPSCYRYASVNYKLPYMTMSCLLSYILWEDRNSKSAKNAKKNVLLSFQNSRFQAFLYRDPLHQGWPTRRSRSTGRSPNVKWSIAPDFALNWHDTLNEHFSIKKPLYCILWHFLLVSLLPTGRSRVIKKFSSRSHSKTSWPALHYTNPP